MSQTTVHKSILSMVNGMANETGDDASSMASTGWTTVF